MFLTSVGDAHLQAARCTACSDLIGVPAPAARTYFFGGALEALPQTPIAADLLFFFDPLRKKSSMDRRQSIQYTLNLEVFLQEMIGGPANEG